VTSAQLEIFNAVWRFCSTHGSVLHITYTLIQET
jgi:hypothetical protein